ncbi:hypothetical protein ACYSNW_00300 [Enterococcus sp. LJL99]
MTGIALENAYYYKTEEIKKEDGYKAKFQNLLGGSTKKKTIKIPVKRIEFLTSVSGQKNWDD